MPLLILLIVIAVPLGELWLLITVGSVIGATWAVLACIATATIGLTIIRLQGVGLLTAARGRFARGQPPVMEALEGAGLAVAGLLLMFPGFASDTLGFFLLLPPLRAGLISLILGRLVARSGGQEPPRRPAGRWHHDPSTRPSTGASHRPPVVPPVIEGDWRVDEEDEKPRDDDRG